MQAHMHSHYAKAGDKLGFHTVGYNPQRACHSLLQDNKSKLGLNGLWILDKLIIMGHLQGLSN